MRKPEVYEVNLNLASAIIVVWSGRIDVMMRFGDNSGTHRVLMQIVHFLHEMLVIINRIFVEAPLPKMKWNSLAVDIVLECTSVISETHRDIGSAIMLRDTA